MFKLVEYEKCIVCCTLKEFDDIDVINDDIPLCNVCKMYIIPMNTSSNMFYYWQNAIFNPNELLNELKEFIVIDTCKTRSYKNINCKYDFILKCTFENKQLLKNIINKYGFNVKINNNDNATITIIATCILKKLYVR